MNALAEKSAPTDDVQTAVSFQRARRNKSYDLSEFCTSHCSSTSAAKETKCKTTTAAELKKAYDEGAESSVLKSCVRQGASQYHYGLKGYPKSTGKVQYM